MEARLTVAFVSFLLLASVVAGPALLARPAAAQETCGQSVTHDALRSQAAVEAVNATGEATSTVDNTKVRVEDVPGFVRLHAENPNGYCVAFAVEISPEIVSPADLGQIESNDGNATASWRASQNLTDGTVVTHVEFTVPAGESVTFAPSSVRVQSLSWTGRAKQESQGALAGLRDLWGSSSLEKREYEIEPTGDSSRITVPLENDGQQIEDWHATYELDGQTRPVEQDASAPVYYTESDSSLTFHFNQAAVQNDARVTFTAEPNLLERTSFSAESYLAGLTEGRSWLPFATATEVLA